MACSNCGREFQNPGMYAEVMNKGQWCRGDCKMSETERQRIERLNKAAIHRMAEGRKKAAMLQELVKTGQLTAGEALKKMSEKNV